MYTSVMTNSVVGDGAHGFPCRIRDTTVRWDVKVRLSLNFCCRTHVGLVVDRDADRRRPSRMPKFLINYYL